VPDAADVSFPGCGTDNFSTGRMCGRRVGREPPVAYPQTRLHRRQRPQGDPMPNSPETERSTPPTARNHLVLWALVVSGVAILVLAISVIVTMTPDPPQRGVREVVEVPGR